MPEVTFNQEQAKLRGMNETSSTARPPSAHADAESIKRRIYRATNVLQVPSDGRLKFAGRTLAGGCLVLVSVELANEKAELTINCEKIVVGSMLAKEIKQRLEEA